MNKMIKMAVIGAALFTVGQTFAQMIPDQDELPTHEEIFAATVSDIYIAPDEFDPFVAPKEDEPSCRPIAFDPFVEPPESESEPTEFDSWYNVKHENE